MNVLIACARNNLPMISIPIETVYENENKGTHYHPFKDSMRIFKVIIRGFVKFMGASIVCFLVDNGIFNLLNLGLFHNGEAKVLPYIGLATAIARIISASLNFLLNKKFVFQLKGDTGGAVWRYALLCVGILLASAGSVWLLGRTGMSSTVAKIIVDTLLYFVSFQVQQKWVFHETGGSK